jgi:lipid A 3-O-deacylase
MKHFLLMVIPILLYGNYSRLFAQNLPSPLTKSQQDTPTRMLRIYEDNDFLNVRGQGTDDAYTNGTRIDYFYMPRRPARWFVDKHLPKAGDSSVNVYGWGITQLMYTPDDISSADYQPNDYPWAGELFVTHSLYSYNPVKKYDLQTELVAGVIGPAALAGEMQALVHHIIHYTHPMGWPHQFRNDVLLNINFTAEKQLAAWGSAVEIIGGGQVFGGTMLNGMALYPLIRIGHMTSYFRGYLSQYSSPGSSGTHSHARKWQAYFILKPEGQLYFTDAILQGGMLTGNPNLRKDNSPSKGQGATGTAGTNTEAGKASSTSQATYRESSQTSLPYHDISRVVWSVNYGAVVSSGNFSISYMQNTSTAMMKGLYSHEFGNISLYFSW